MSSRLEEERKRKRVRQISIEESFKRQRLTHSFEDGSGTKAFGRGKLCFEQFCSFVTVENTDKLKISFSCLWINLRSIFDKFIGVRKFQTFLAKV